MVTGSSGKDPRERKFYELFGEAIAKRGVAAVPLVLLRYQRHLGISLAELGFIIHLLSYRWAAGKPHPSIENLSGMTQTSAVTLHRYKKSLVAKGLLEVVGRCDRNKGKLTNEYDLVPLFDRLRAIIAAEEGAVEPSGGEASVEEQVPDTGDPVVGGVVAEGACIGGDARDIGPSNRDGGMCGNEAPPLSNLNMGMCQNRISPLSKFNMGICQNETSPLSKFKGGCVKIEHEVDQVQVDPGQVDPRRVDPGQVEKTGETDASHQTLPCALTPNNCSLPGNGKLIVELTHRLHEIPQVGRSRGHYQLVGKAYNEYGYETVLAAVEDLQVELAARSDLGLPPVSERDLWRMLLARCRWNVRPRSPPSPDTAGGRAECKDLRDIYDRGPDGRLTPKEPGLPDGWKVVGRNKVAKLGGRGTCEGGRGP